MKAVIVAVRLVVWGSFVRGALLVIRAMIGGVARFLLVAKVTFVLFAVFANMSGVMAFVTNDAGGIGSEIRSGNESSSYVGELLVPSWIFDRRRGWVMNRNFYT
jgi:hypothetical protein